MPVWRLQTSWLLDTAFPRDRMVITPHFNDSGALTDPESLCNDLADALALWRTAASELRISAYDAQGTPPVYPQAEVVRNEGVVGTTGTPREVALCLSFYSQRNLPRQRGRLYIPGFFTTGAQSRIPTAPQMQKVADLAPIFEALGGADVDWCVYSRTTDTAHSITNWWVDNEWDTVRSRGLRATDRLTGTTSEA